MEPPENQTNPSEFSTDASITSAGVQKQFESLHKLFAVLVISTLLLGGALGLFLLRQVFAINRQVTDAKRRVDEFQTNSLPKINWFVSSLQTFARTNPDFNPILAKFNALPAITNAPSAVKSPAPKK